MIRFKNFWLASLAMIAMSGCSNNEKVEEQIETPQTKNSNELIKAEDANTTSLSDELPDDTAHYGKDRSKTDEKEVEKKSADYNPDEVKFGN